MKDFDTQWEAARSEDARAFKVCDFTFHRKAAVQPESLGVALTAVDDLDDKEDSTIEDRAKAMDDLFLLMIVSTPDAVKAYKEIRGRTDGTGLGVADLNEVVMWMIEENTKRPTGLPADSSGGRGSAGTSSTAPRSRPVSAVA